MGTIMNIRRGGGATGCALEVTGVKTGDTVLLQKGDKSYTKTLDSDKKAMFRGLTGGTWTAKMSDGMQNVQREVEITDNYELTMRFFAATINVTYPAGSTCTCTFSFEGETIRTYTAPDTSGSYTFTVSNAADWVVSCTNGTQTASKTVSITQDEQSESVVLTYDLRLFDNGDECVSVTGGWTNTGYTYDLMSPTPPEISDGRIKLYGKPEVNTSIGTAQSIDLTGYSKLVIDRDVLSTYSAYTAGRLWLLPSKNVINTQAKATLEFGSATGRAEQEIDVTNINMPVYVFTSTFGNAQYKVDIYGIRLKK